MFPFLYGNGARIYPIARMTEWEEGNLLSERELVIESVCVMIEFGV